MIDSLFLETFSIPLLSTLSLIFFYYKQFQDDVQIQNILLVIMTLGFFIFFDRLNKLTNNTRTVLLYINVILLYLLCVSFLYLRKPDSFKYIIIILITTLSAIIIESSLISDRNIMLMLGVIILLYSIFKEAKPHFIFLILLYISFLIIDSPVNEINV